MKTTLFVVLSLCLTACAPQPQMEVDKDKLEITHGIYFVNGGVKAPYQSTIQPDGKVTAEPVK